LTDRQILRDAAEKVTALAFVIMPEDMTRPILTEADRQRANHERKEITEAFALALKPYFEAWGKTI
jgi:hypothetical protein